MDDGLSMFEKINGGKSADKPATEAEKPATEADKPATEAKAPEKPATREPAELYSRYYPYYLKLE